MQNHMTYPISDWQEDVASGDTWLGYAAWLAAKLEDEFAEDEEGEE